MTDKKIKKRKVAKEIYPTPLDREYLTPIGFCRWLRERSKAVGMKPASNYTRKIREWIDTGSLQTEDVRVVETKEEKAVFSRTRREGKKKHTSKREAYDPAKHGDWNGDTKKVGRGSTVIETIQFTEERIHRQDWVRFVVEHMDWLIPERQEGVFKKAAGLIDNGEKHHDDEYYIEAGKRHLEHMSDMGVKRHQDAEEQRKGWAPYIQERDQLMKENPSLSKIRASVKVADRHPEANIKVNTLRLK
ncbi:MAG: hypothetical protein AB2697_21340 [Candidatus Thiodiazotropha endolucinida]